MFYNQSLTTGISFFLGFIKHLNIASFIDLKLYEDDKRVTKLSLADLIGVILMLGIFALLNIALFFLEFYWGNGQ